MNLIASFKARSAAKQLGAGNLAEAKKLYEEAIQAGLSDPRYLLSYSVLLIRQGEYASARELLVKHQNNPQFAGESKRQLFVNYAVCVYKMGEIQKGIEILERQHAKEPSGLVFETLGYLYVEQGDKEKAVAFNLEAMEYDDEDAITLDNLGQTYYRLTGEKDKARTYFEKALKIKPTQIDTLYFLAQYDLEEGNKEAAKQKLTTALEGRFSPLNYVNKDKINAQLATLA